MEKGEAGSVSGAVPWRAVLPKLGLKCVSNWMRMEGSEERFE